MQEGLINGGLTVVNEMTLRLRAEPLYPVSEIFQELIFLSSRYRGEIPVLHFYLTTISFNIPLDIIQVDDMRMMRTEKVSGGSNSSKSFSVRLASNLG